jgi:hypothetical protein
MASIYALCEPGTGEIRCIGQTHLELTHRLKLYISSARKGRARTSRWLQKLIREGRVPTIIELERVYGDQGFLDAAEESWIAYGRRLKLRLTNLLPGGAGHRGPRTESFRQKQRKPKSAAQRANMYAAQKQRWKDPAAHERMSAALNRPETRKRLSDAAKRQHAEGRSRWGHNTSSNGGDDLSL